MTPGGPATLVVVTPWYPTADRPHYGVFVREWLRSLRRPADGTLVIHLENVPPGTGAVPHRETTDLGDLWWVPVEVPALAPRAQAARLQRRALEAHRPPELDRADVVHAHVTMPSGWAVAGLLPESTRLVLTEHATYLRRVLDAPDARELYAQALTRADRLLMVGEVEARQVRAAFPDLAERVTTVGNPVPLDALPLLPAAPSPRLGRWLYVGNLIPRKGVVPLVEAFAHWHRRRPGPDDRLVIAGGGELHDALLDRARELGVQDRVDLVGPVDPEHVPALLAEADVLVHLSDLETFGLTVVEAAVSGVPVVVTACGGPEETLNDAREAGMAAIVPVRASAGAVADAVDALAHRSRSADRTGVRTRLAQRYGGQAFGVRVARVLDGGLPDPSPDPDGPMVLTVALSWDGWQRVRPVQAAVLREGGRVGLVTNVPGEAAVVDRRIWSLDLDRPGSRGPLRTAEHVLLWVVPSLPLRALRLGCLLLGGLPGALGTAGIRGSRVAARALTRLRLAGQSVHHRVLRPCVYSRLDQPRLLSLVSERHRAELSALGTVRLVPGDPQARRLAERIAEVVPGATVIDPPPEARVAELLH